MASYPTIQDIAAERWALGRGICIIGEGATQYYDAWFYNQWFGDLAQEVTFFAQNGFEQVETAVAVLRSRISPKRVYGIIGRDFAPLELYPPIPPNGIVRTPKYTLENYLLDPDCWFRYVRPHTVRAPKPGWSSLIEARSIIEALYRRCLPISAYNMTLREARNLDRAAFTALPETIRTFA